jgi:hypothetical protein
MGSTNVLSGRGGAANLAHNSFYKKHLTTLARVDRQPCFCIMPDGLNFVAVEVFRKKSKIASQSLLTVGAVYDRPGPGANSFPVLRFSLFQKLQSLGRKSFHLKGV